jgi:hypothetical protein
MTYKLYYNDANKYKLNQLLEVSDPKTVIQNAQKYFKDPFIKVYLSPDKHKKYAIYNPILNKLVSFGHIDYEDYTKHKNEIRRENYLKRASNMRGNWKINPYSPNNLSIHLLW